MADLMGLIEEDPNAPALPLSQRNLSPRIRNSLARLKSTLYNDPTVYESLRDRMTNNLANIMAGYNSYMQPPPIHYQAQPIFGELPQIPQTPGYPYDETDEYLFGKTRMGPINYFRPRNYYGP
jgi:hypothetical protein